MTTSAVEARGVGVAFGKTRVLDAVDLVVAPRELVALLGPSGCGKTTLLRTLAGLQAAHEGSVLLGGADVTHTPARRRRIGFVFQHYGLFPTMTALDNVAFPLHVAKVDAGTAAAKARDLLATVGMSDLHGRRPAELSGGQQQRVALARALAREPEVLLLDEPLSALDAVIRDSLRDEIRALQQRLGLAVVHVTHDQGEAMAMADRVAVMDRGRIVEIGPPAELYRAPKSVITARFVGSRNEVSVTPTGTGGVGWVGALDLPGAPLDTVGALFPPEAVSVGMEGTGAAGTVVISAFQGPTVRLVLEIGETTVIAECPSSDAARFPPGTVCVVRVDPAAVTLVPADSPRTASGGTS